MKKIIKKVMKKNFAKLALAEHKKYGGKIELTSKFKLETKDDLSIAYTPGVGAVVTEIAANKSAKKYTLKKNTIAIISDGSAILGLGNLGSEAAIPVMEGKAALLKRFGLADAFPICLDTQDSEEIIKTIKNIAPVFGGINLEDISAPRCFDIEERLKKEMNIVVMHDDQWGAATVTLTALINAAKLVKKNLNDKNTKLVMSGLGAAGVATVRLIKAFAPEISIIALDSEGIVSNNRKNLNKVKLDLLKNKIIEGNIDGDLALSMSGADVFVGLSKPNVLTSEMVKTMKTNSIIFALANPFPEIMPDIAKKAGAMIVGTGRSDFPNQINNSVFFPGFWRGALDAAQKTDNTKYDLDLFVDCAVAMAKSVKGVNAENILPSTLDEGVHKIVAKTVEKYFLKK
jgi:malate dehydrogenase (oxaloacetate-decarboxylating)